MYHSLSQYKSSHRVNKVDICNVNLYQNVMPINLSK